MKKERLFLSTIADDAVQTAREFGLGVELAQFCLAENMDKTPPDVQASLDAALEVPRRVLHAPFAELCPAAIDPLVREVAKRRFLQAAALAKRYGAEKMVVHSGFIPLVYYPEWFAPQSAAFWREFLNDVDGLTLCVENVMETSPDALRQVAEQVNDPRLRICFDVGHAFCQSGELAPWLDALAPYSSHVHLHNNHGTFDEHLGLPDGTLDMATVIRQLEALAPQATYTLEVRSARASVEWLLKEGLLS
ncbi:MAG: sugar phosphate isomerase/epimerase [Clostridiales bacterium]|nr:sugar phosphate isomerase/epimerase [Clostridiales bacterium]